jgi:uncharacterized protein YacL
MKCDNDQYINNVFSFLLKNMTGKTLCYNHCIYYIFFNVLPFVISLVFEFFGFQTKFRNQSRTIKEIKIYIHFTI